MHITRYKGTFYSRKGVSWQVRITQEEGTFADGGELTFPDEDPLTIELEDNAKEETICGSIAELTIVSPGDRTYNDLYAEQAGAIRLEVYRNGLLYWMGSLDPEFYEEPYAYKDDYEVTLTFSDFGALDRIKYNLNGIRTLLEILQNGLSRIGLDIDVNQDYISTLFDGEACTLDRLQIRSDNFEDEDGEWMSMKSVIESMLQPLALKMVQRCGTIYIYDLNGLYHNGKGESIEWVSDDQVLGTDKVANNAKITLSVYADETIISDDIKLVSEIDKEAINLQNTATGINSYYPDYTPDWLESADAYKNISFSIHYGANVKLEGLAEIGGIPFHIQPFFGGDEADGVAYMFYTGGHGSLKSGYPQRIGYNIGSSIYPTVLMRTKKIYLPSLSNYNDFLLRLTENILVDTRYNPFTQSGKYNENDNYECIKNTTGYFLIPVMVQLYDDNGTVIAHYNNAKKTKSSETMGFANSKGEWKSGPDPLETQYIKGKLPYFTADAISCFLEWYDKNDRKGSSGIQGWQENSHSIGLSQKDVTGLIDNLEKGEYIPYPSMGGYLEVTIVSGIYPYDYGEMWYHNGLPTSAKWQSKKNYDRLRWLLYQAPTVTLCKNTPPYDGMVVDDIEYTGVINVNAKEDIEIDTIVGTSEDAIPSSRALLMSSSGKHIATLERAGRTATAEQLLIGTLYSQYGSRHTKLSGTVAPIVLPLPLLTENLQGDIKFLMTSCLENCKEDTSEIVMVELRPDEYTDS